MILATLFILMFAGGVGIMFALILLAIGYRDMARRATQAANHNAGYWAQAEEKAALAEAHNERLMEIAIEAQRVMGKMTDHAREALKLAQETHPDARIKRVWSDGDLVYDSDDSILNAREIDG